ncbi:MAG: hypothetical protein M1532_04535, partial [Nitrospirae bacterium]|nr:hypothetical protein [Nitrospirota bacterium]
MAPDWTSNLCRMFRISKRFSLSSFLILFATVVLFARVTPAKADQPFSWQSVSFDGGPAFLLGGSVTGFLNGKPVASTNLLDLENNGMMFHVRWGSYVLPHLGLRFSVGYETFSANRGFSGLSRSEERR